MGIDNSTVEQEVASASGRSVKESKPIEVARQDDLRKPPLSDRPWFRVMLAFLPVIPGCFIALFSYHQYLHNQAIFCDYTRNSQGESSVISIDGMDATPMGWHLNITWESRFSRHVPHA